MVRSKINSFEPAYLKLLHSGELKERVKIETRERPWGPLDVEQLRLLARVPVAKRLRTMLETQALAMSILRGRLRRRYPDLPQREINLLVLKEVSRSD